MSSLKNSPFGKRLRAAQHDTDDDEPKRTKPRVNPIFGLAPASLSSHSLESRATSSDGGAATDSSVERRIKDYGDRFVPSRDTGDMRTSYNLLDESGPSTPSKSRMIPSESDALKGDFASSSSSSSSSLSLYFPSLPFTAKD
jgi:cell division cycle 20-like protein 1, cofactor of APC complex